MKTIVLKSFFTFVLISIFFPSASAATWRTCNSGIWESNSGSTTLTFSKDGGPCISPYNAAFVIAAGDFIDFLAPHNVSLASNISIGVNVTVRFYGAVSFDNGKLDLTTNSTIQLYAGSTLTCSGGCGNNDQIRIGSTQYKGDDLNTINNAPRPTTVGSAGILPVNLLFFNGKTVEKQVILQWATAIEKDFNYFVIERSASGKEFYEIGKRKGAGNSNVRIDYKFDDPSPFVGRSYYRLKAVDFDGYTEYFNIVVIDFVDAKSVSIYPNPYRDSEELTIALNFANDETSYASIYDSRGLEQLSFNFSGPEYKTSIPLSAGSYILKIRSGSTHYISRLVVR